MRALAAIVAALLAWVSPVLAQPVPYDIVAVKAPRYGDSVPTTWQEVDYAAAVEPGQSLVLIHPDGSEETLVDCVASGCSVVDPVMSLDGLSVYYSLYPDMRFEAVNPQRGLPYEGADIYRMRLSTREITRLTFQEFDPNDGPVSWASDPLNSGNQSGKFRLGYGILNLGACPVPGPHPGTERIVFTSNRHGFIPARGLTLPNLQLFAMDADGRNVRFIGPMNLGSAMHPTVLKDGRVMFSSSEGQGARDERVWGLWSVLPDGRQFQPLMSAFADAAAFHFQTQLSAGDIAVTEYYNLNNNGFGTVLAFSSQAPAFPLPGFGSPTANHSSNPAVRRGYWWFSPGHPSHRQPRYKQYPFSPIGLRNLTAFAHGEDEASSLLPTGEYAGKVTHPSGAPDNDLLLIYSPGPVNDLPRPETTPRVWGGIYLLRGGAPVETPSELVLIKRDPSFNYQQPRAAVSYQAVYGQATPRQVASLPDGNTPFAIVGTASFYNRNTKPGFGSQRFDGLDPFNTSENGASSNWGAQGADAGKYSSSDIHAVRVLSMEPTSHLSYGPDGHQHTRSFASFAGERLRILGEIPLRKPGPNGEQPLDGDGNPDTSFLARIPADVPFTFQTIDKDGMVLNMSQTWHHLRPGEQRFDCGGCHAHARNATDFSMTAASRPGYVAWDLVSRLTLLTKDGGGNPQVAAFTGEQRKARMDVEYLRDIKPILQRSCAGCHTSQGGQTPAGNLDLADTTLESGLERAYRCLADDSGAECGYKPVIPARVWRQTNASRWVRRFQSRRSLLIWKIFGRRLDGWTNADHPTESVPGDAATLPAGANPNDADLDFTGTIMPPPGSGFQPLTEDEKLTFARWVDLGAPSDRQGGDAAISGWFVDEVRPTLNISVPRPEVVRSLSRIEIAAHDYYSGLDAQSLSVVADFEVNGAPAGSELAPLFTTNGSVWTLGLGTTVVNLPSGTITVRIADNTGNIATQEAKFSVNENGAPEPAPAPDPAPEPGPISPDAPRILGRSIVRMRMKTPVAHQIRATKVGRGFRPIVYTAMGLPRGMKLTKKGTLKGRIGKKGRYSVTVTVANRHGVSAPRVMTLVVRAPKKPSRPRR